MYLKALNSEIIQHMKRYKCVFFNLLLLFL